MTKIEFKNKVIFKGAQVSVSVFLNYILYMIIRQYYPTNDEWVLLGQIFAIALFSVIISNGIGMLIIHSTYKEVQMKSFLSDSNSYVQFFSVSILYAFLMSATFTFGFFWLAYSIIDDGSWPTFLLFYFLVYIILEFFSYGLVSWLFKVYQTLNDEK